ncbi:MAG: hypothetical protein WCR56_04585 [Bacilli bacterium]
MNNNETKTTNNTTEENDVLHNVDIYKWLKVVQSVILVALGIIFIVTAYFSNDGFSGQALGYSMGVVFSCYGLISLIAGYLLYRSPFSQEVLYGTIMVSLSIVLFIKPNLITEILSYLLIGFIFTFSVILIVYGVDKCLGRGTKKNVPSAVLSFVGAALLIALGIVYAYFNNNNNAAVQKWLTIIIGVTLIIVGLTNGIMLLVKVKNTKKVIKETAFQNTPNVNTSDEVLNKDVKIVDYSDLKKAGRSKKVHNKQNAEEPKKIEDTPSSEDQGNDTSEQK